MYNTNIKNNKYLAECIMVNRDVNMAKFIVDTGAMFTCCNYKILDIHLEESELADNEIKALGGFVRSIPVTFYKCSLKQFTIGNIDLGKQDIWITFDERVTDTVLGMDILQQVIFTANPYNRKMCFCKDAADYDQHFQLDVV